LTTLLLVCDIGKATRTTLRLFKFRHQRRKWSLNQNRHQKLFSRGLCVSAGRLWICAGGWHSKNWQKFNSFIVFHVSVWGAWSLIWGLSPQKPHLPVETGLLLTM